jgi:hypothetical protein
MKQVLVEFDERTLAAQKTAEAYARHPDVEPAFFDPEVWEPVAVTSNKKATARRQHGQSG